MVFTPKNPQFSYFIGDAPVLNEVKILKFHRNSGTHKKFGGATGELGEKEIIIPKSS